MKTRIPLKALVHALLFASVIASCPADIVAWGDSMTYGTGADHPDKGEKTWPKWFTEFSGIKVIKKGVGGESSRQIRDRMLAEPALHKEFTVIWAGRNDYPGPQWVKKNIAEMVAALNHDNYLVVGITNNTLEAKGGDKLKIIDTLNADLKAAYGSRFVDVRPLLVAAYDKTLPQDVADHESDVVPASLRSDKLHLNTAGYRIVAQAICDAYRKVAAPAPAPPQ
ncbi:MAG TPA: GDSL-type esterase/lipase family protein [Rariglobus sp.]